MLYFNTRNKIKMFSILDIDQTHTPEIWNSTPIPTPIPPTIYLIHMIDIVSKSGPAKGDPTGLT